MSNKPNLRCTYKIKVTGTITTFCGYDSDPDDVSDDYIKTFTGKVATYMSDIDFDNASDIIQFMRDKLADTIVDCVKHAKYSLRKNQSFGDRYGYCKSDPDASLVFTSISVLKPGAGWVPVNLTDDLDGYTII